MELRIDSKACDLGEGKLAIPAYDAATLADVQACRTGRTLRLELPATPRNDAVMEFAREALSAGRFDAAEHRAVLSYGGAELFAGSVRLLATTDAGYRIEIRDGGAQWAETAARRMFSALEIDYDAQLTSETVSESWTGDTPVRFFPVHRDEYPQRNNSEDLLPGERLLSTDDYLPFLHVATLAERIFEQTGYRVRSRFFGSEFFRSLYLSGAYASRDTTVLAARMGFCARRLSEASATADHLGRVYADPNAIYSTVGNIVETAAAGVADADGEKVEETFDNGGCFVTEEGKIRFVPTTEVTAGFEYYLRYTTDHRIESRTRLRGFDTLWLTPGTPMAFALANRYEDRRAAIEPGFRYRIVVFDHAEGDSYRLTCTHDAVTGTVWGSFAARSALVTTPAAGSLSDPALLVLRGGVWEPYAGDWALYDGYVGETGRTTVEVRVCTEAERVAPASPKRFDRIFFSGADEGMTLTLHKECSLRPCFRTGPGFGAWMTFADVARHRMRQIELIEALAHLFNLRFYTEHGTRTVWIEPADDFFGAGPEVDWSDRTDFSQEVVRTRIAPEVHERRTWRYLPAEGAVARFETETGTTFGAWSYDTDSRAALQGEQVRTSPLFAATLDSVGHYAGAPSARMLQIGDRDAAEQDPTSFTPRIVRYAGMRPLPDGERWGYPGGNTYPLAAFHFEGDAATEGFTLGFGDCDGIEGLHRFYDRQLARETLRERIRLALRIAPDEYAALFAPGCGTAELRSVFRIDTGTGVVRALLRGVDDYDPEAGVVRCTFERLVED